MLVKTEQGSISFVAGCCWVNSVAQPSAAKGSRDDKNNSPFQWLSIFRLDRSAH
jgi:hypothetical protein